MAEATGPSSASQALPPGEGGPGGTASASDGLLRPVRFIFDWLRNMFDQIGSVSTLALQVLRWTWRWLTFRVALGGEIIKQSIRVGVKALGIVSIVSGAVGLILVLEMAPPLDEFGSKQLVANILGVAVLRELGPLIAAIVLTGYGGAAIAAELGTMVVGEEIEAMQAHALNPVRFLVVPRVLSTVLALFGLAVASNVAAIGAGMLIAYLQLDIPITTFWSDLLHQVKPKDFITGVGKAVVFGALIGLIACTNGLKVTRGAEGVGKATTQTVVQSVVAIVIADLLFTLVFFAWKLFE